MSDAVEKVIKLTGLFLRPTGKGLAKRYGDQKPMGSKRFDTEKRRHVIDTTVVIAITHQESYRYRREYQRQITEGCVEKVDANAYRAFIKASHEAGMKAQRAAKKAADKAAKEAAKETGSTETESGEQPSKE